MSYTPQTWVDDVTVVTAARMNYIESGIAGAGGGGGGGVTELAYAYRNTDLAVTATSAAAAQDVISSGAVSYAGTRIKIEVFCARVKVTSGGYAIFALWDGSTNLNVALGQVYYQGSVSLDAPFYAQYFVTPSAGSHTYWWKVWMAASAVTLYSTPGSDAPTFIRVTSGG